MLAALDKVQTSLTLFSFARHLTVEVKHQALLTWKSLVDEQVLLIMSHIVAKIHILHAPAMTLELMHNYPMKILVVQALLEPRFHAQHARQYQLHRKFAQYYRDRWNKGFSLHSRGGMKKIPHIFPSHPMPRKSRHAHSQRAMRTAARNERL